jgi:hypothetical protein
VTDEELERLVAAAEEGSLEAVVALADSRVPRRGG